MPNLFAWTDLRTYGNSLLKEKSASWLRKGALLAFITAFCDAVAWGAFGLSVAAGAPGWIIALVLFGAVFATIWTADTLILTANRAEAEHADLANEPPQQRWKPYAALGMRVVMLSLGMALTANYLAMLVLTRSIDDKIAQQATTAIDGARKELKAKLAADEAKSLSLVQQKQADYEHEMAGRGLTGKHGEGPVAKALHAEKDRLLGDYNKLLDTDKAQLSDFEQAAAAWKTNPSLLTDKYNVHLPGGGAVDRRNAFEELRKTDPSTEAVVWGAKGLLLFFFLSLIAHKLWAPHEVLLYQSHALQGWYDRLIDGSLDVYLPAWKRAMEWKQKVNAQAFLELSRAILAIKGRKEIDELTRYIAAAKEELNLELAVLLPLEDAASGAGEALTQKKLDISDFQAAVSDSKSQLEALATDTKIDPLGRERMSAILRGDIRDTELKLRLAVRELPGLEQAKAKADGALERPHARVAALQATLEEREARLRKLCAEICRTTAEQGLAGLLGFDFTATDTRAPRKHKDDDFGGIPVGVSADADQDDSRRHIQ